MVKQALFTWDQVHQYIAENKERVANNQPTYGWAAHERLIKARRQVECWEEEEPSPFTQVFSWQDLMEVSYNVLQPDVLLLEPRLCVSSLEVLNEENIFTKNMLEHSPEKETMVWRYNGTSIPVVFSSDTHVLLDSKGIAWSDASSAQPIPMIRSPFYRCEITIKTEKPGILVRGMEVDVDVTKEPVVTAIQFGTYMNATAEEIEAYRMEQCVRCCEESEATGPYTVCYPYMVPLFASQDIMPTDICGCPKFMGIGIFEQFARFAQIVDYSEWRATSSE